MFLRFVKFGAKTRADNSYVYRISYMITFISIFSFIVYKVIE